MNETVNISSLFSISGIFYITIATFLGIVVGALPGLTATMAVSLLVSLTFGLSANNAIIVLVSVYLGGIYGGSRAAILLNVPGTPSSAATALDGFALCKKGEGALASIVVTIFSGLGGIFGLFILMIATPLIAKLALKFGVWEYFWLAIIGVIISGSLTSNEVYKGLISGFLGLLVTCIGIDPIHGYPRFVFGYNNLLGGISLVPAMIGLFGIAEAFSAIKNPMSHFINKDFKESSTLSYVITSFKMIFERPILFIRSAIIGTAIGALPGVGPDIASWVSYGAAKQTTNEKEKFGKGSYEGIISSETANNSATSGVFIPLLTLGIPGCAVSAVILGGIQLHGFRPGPLFFFKNPEFVYFICGILLFTNIIMMIEGVFMTKILVKILTVDMGIIMPIIIVLSIIGSYAINLRLFEISVMLIFGFLGMIMNQFKIPVAPLALGIILGQLADLNLRRALLINSSIGPFFTRPVSMLLVIFISFIFMNLIWKKHKKRKGI